MSQSQESGVSMSEPSARPGQDSPQAKAETPAYDLLYAQLRRLARRELRGSSSTLVCTTVLVHEAWLKIHEAQALQMPRRQFLVLAAKAIRHALVDHVRRHRAIKRGGELIRVTLQTDLSPQPASEGIDLLDIERGLQQLEALDPRLARVVECRFYADMEFDEIADALELSLRTVHRDWRKARAFLLAHLGDAA